MNRDSDDPFQLGSELLGALPVVNHFLSQVGLDRILAEHLGPADPRWRVSPAKALGVVIRNLVVDHRPVYALGEWARPHAPAVLGLERDEADGLNDDRVGRALDVLFDSDRASLLSRVVLRAITAFGIDCSQLHNDSTSITFTGAYRDSGPARGGRTAAKITHGYNKDHCPDLCQLVWILTVTADGAVPIAHRVESGNTTDDTTHIATWDHLAAMLGRTDFVYVADSKLCTRAQMDHIDGAGGRFVTVLPRTRREDRWFRDWLTRNQAPWTEAMRRPARRQAEPPDVYSTYEPPTGSSEGHRIIWVRSTSKRDRDASRRAKQINRATAALEDLAHRLTGPKCRIKTRVAAIDAAQQTLADHDAARYFDIFVVEHVDKTYTADHPGTPGPKTTFRQQTRPRFTLNWKARAHIIRDEAASDGCFPLITNDDHLNPAELLAAYKHQPHLERRHHLLKSAQSVAPVLLHNPAASKPYSPASSSRS